jgi:lactate dehydrogenase-like 2-hydroxyacid dehydrogenase
LAASATRSQGVWQGLTWTIAYSGAPQGLWQPAGSSCADPSLAERSDFLFVTLAASAATRHIVGAG